ncbi:AlpA family transcriptional regulator [Acidovorax sp. LjRoot74]|jgi:prophage regulatory protein|uniref:helix-turn-helix transcriptional regulator n=1 Tax=Acidovorax sp. LjRoot74 TaxID=3342337 RepID=UPI003ED13F82
MTTYINRKQLLAKVPLSDRTIYNLEKRGAFPKRITLTARNVAWDLNEVEAWMRTRRESANKPMRPPCLNQDERQAA